MTGPETGGGPEPLGAELGMLDPASRYASHAARYAAVRAGLAAKYGGIGISFSAGPPCASPTGPPAQEILMAKAPSGRAQEECLYRVEGAAQICRKEAKARGMHPIECAA